MCHSTLVTFIHRFIRSMYQIGKQHTALQDTMQVCILIIMFSNFQRTLICFAELTGVEPAVRRSTVYHTHQLYYSLMFYSFRDIVSHFHDIFHTILIVCYIRNITIHEIHLYCGHGQYINF